MKWFFELLSAPAIARNLTDAEFTPAQADAITELFIKLRSRAAT